METLSETSEHSQNRKNWALEGLVRCHASDAIPSRIINETVAEQFLPRFAELIKAESPTLLDDGSLPPCVDDIKVGDLKCTAVVFLPIRSTGDNILGFLLVGINPRKAFDNDYKILMELLSRQLTTSMAVSFRHILEIFADCSCSRQSCSKKSYAVAGWLQTKRIKIRIFCRESWKYRDTKLMNWNIDSDAWPISRPLACSISIEKEVWYTPITIITSKFTYHYLSGCRILPF